MSSKIGNELIVIKYGGNAMLNQDLTKEILKNVAALQNEGTKVVIVHGGGPFIKDNLKLAGIESEFIAGHRKTTSEAMKYIEMSLKGEVNGNIVRELNNLGAKAVGLSGKDGRLAVAEKRLHINEKKENIDLGQVGDVSKISTEIINLLLENGFIPVVTSIATGEDGIDYNINADMFAGHLAAELKADKFLMLTDVDGLMEDHNDENSLMTELHINQIEKMNGTIIKGGMIPKTEACKIAVTGGAKEAAIINGTKPELIAEINKNGNKIKGTVITA